MKDLREKLFFLDGIRGLAALYVLIHHARWVLWEGYHEGYLQNSTNYNVVEVGIMYFLASFKFGHEVVILFFLLSGFVIHLKYSFLIKNKQNEAKFDFWHYLKRRFKRIYPPLLLAIVVTFILDQLGKQLQLPIYTYPSLYTSINENLNPDYSFISLLGNLVFLMDIYVPVWGTAGPLWSLAYEWWFYVFYPLFFYASRKDPWLPLGILTILCIAATSFKAFPVTLLNHIFGLMVTWWFGAFLADVFTGRIQFPFKYLTLTGILPACFFVVYLFYPFVFQANYYFVVCSLGFLALFATLFHFNRKRNLSFLKVLSGLGNISYSVYILHMPVLTLMSGIVMSLSPGEELPSGFYFVFLGVVVGLGVGWIGYQIAEKPFLKRTK